MVAAICYVSATCVLFYLMPSGTHSSLLVYIGSLTASLVLATLEQVLNGKKIKRVLLVSAVVVLALPMALRAQTGIDDITYSRAFARSANIGFFDYLRTGGRGPDGETFEKGYLALLYVLHRITAGDYNIAQLVITMITFGFFALAMLRDGGDEGLPLQLLLIWSNYYFTIFDAGLMRIFLAASIVFLALSYLFEGNVRVFTFLVILAWTFHISALIMLLILPLGRLPNIERRWVTYIFRLLIIIPVAFIAIARFVVPLLGQRYSGYGTVSGLAVAFNKFDVVPLFLLCAMRLNNGKEEPAPRHYYICLIMMALSTIISVMSSMVPLGRLVYYTNLAVVYLCPRASLRCDGTVLDYFIPALLVLYAFVYVGYTRFIGAQIPGTIFPYISFV